MSEAPERTALKKTEGYEHNWWGVVTHEYDDDGVEYIRKDVHRAEVESAAERALDGAARRLQELSVRFDYNLDDEIQAILELEPAQFVDGET